MKKITLIGINAKYIHSNLAIRNLSQACDGCVDFYEFTINDVFEKIVARLIELDSDLYAFSCYIWNIELIYKLCEVVKKGNPSCKILLGGPEVSYDPTERLARNPAVDYIFCGEGEENFPKIVKLFQTTVEDENFVNINGLYTQYDQEKATHLVTVQNLSEIRFGYTSEMIEELSGRIIYYESMRGCPFNCSYCLSSTLSNVRYYPLTRVFSELQLFANHNVKQVKFVDRTFNVNRERAKAILSFLLNLTCQTNFHFEIAADLLDEELLSIISKAPLGRFQFEVGIQSTDKKTLEAITRKTDLDKVGTIVRRLSALDCCHVHVDLIAGLPYEDYDIFQKSFNETMELRPQMLQLGFLKLLPGTMIRQEAEQYGYNYESFAPYEIISNNFISTKELYQLKRIEELVDRYYNSGLFERTFNWLLDNNKQQTSFEFFDAFSRFWHTHGYGKGMQSRDSLYPILCEFLYFLKIPDYIIELIKWDACCHGIRKMPSVFGDVALPSKDCFSILKDNDLISTAFPMLTEISPKKRMKNMVFCTFSKAFAEQFTEGKDVGIFFKGDFLFIKRGDYDNIYTELRKNRYTQEEN